MTGPRQQAPGLFFRGAKKCVGQQQALWAPGAHRTRSFGGQENGCAQFFQQAGQLQVVANRPLMKEAALYYEEELAEQLMLVYKDESLRKRLIENGRDLRSLYSWENCTDRLWQCMTAAINK